MLGGAKRLKTFRHVTLVFDRRCERECTDVDEEVHHGSYFHVIFFERQDFFLLMSTITADVHLLLHELRSKTDSARAATSSRLVEWSIPTQTRSSLYWETDDKITKVTFLCFSRLFSASFFNYNAVN